MMMFFNTASVIDLSLLVAFAGASYLAGAGMALRFNAKALPRHLALVLSGVTGILLGLSLSWLSHSLLLVLFPNDRALLQAGDLMNMGLLAIAAYWGIKGNRAGAA